MSTFGPAPSGASAFFDPNAAPVGGGVPQTSQGQQFLLEEEAGFQARGQHFDISGTLIPPQYAGDFWQFFQLAEQFAANNGWQYLLSPQQLIAGLQQGLGVADTQAAFTWMAQATGAWKQNPWAGSGLSATQWAQQTHKASDSLYALTGTSDWQSAGLGAVGGYITMANWSQQELQDFILQHPDLSSRYGYLKYGYTYQTFQQYKTQNADALRSRYGSTYTDAQAIENIGAPLTQFHASGGQFGAYQPFVKSDVTMPTGFQSGAR